MALPSKSNQNKIKPLSWHLKITSLVISGVATIAANINPFPLISSIKGCTKSSLNSFSFSIVCEMRFVSVTSCKVAKQAAAMTGCPPKVVMCPNLGLSLSKSMYSGLAVKAPTGIPPPIPLPIMTMSGTTS